jgi:hypothetical protein
VWVTITLAPENGAEFSSTIKPLMFDVVVWAIKEPQILNKRKVNRIIFSFFMCISVGLEVLKDI